jgi:hypothetical protein
MNKPLCIIPSAGLGNRMSMKLNESKEMLPDPNGGRIIDYPINLCHRFNLDPLFIIRKEKHDLVTYTKQYEQVKLSKPTKEWPHTVLRSQHKWREKNLLLLPDTRFKPVDSIQTALEMLDVYDVIFGVHKVSDLTRWGYVLKVGNDCMVGEKYQDVIGEGWAWGFIAFRNSEIASNMFKVFRDRNVLTLVKNSDIIKLDSFVDLTRTGKVLKYES